MMRYYNLLIVCFLITSAFGQKAELVLPEGHSNGEISYFSTLPGNILVSEGSEGSDRYQCRWDLASGKLIEKKILTESIYYKRPYGNSTSDGRYRAEIYAGSGYLFDESGEKNTKAPDNIGGIAEDGRAVLTERDGKVSIYGYPDFELIKEIQLPTQAPLDRYNLVWLSSDLRFIVTGLSIGGGGIKIWDLTKRELVYDSPELPFGAEVIDFHPSKSHLLVYYSPRLTEQGGEAAQHPQRYDKVGRFNLESLSIDQDYVFGTNGGFSLVESRYSEDGDWVIGLKNKGSLVSLVSETGKHGHEFRTRVVAPIQLAFSTTDRLTLYESDFPISRRGTLYVPISESNLSISRQAMAYHWQLDRVAPPISQEEITPEDVPAPLPVVQFRSDLDPTEFDFAEYRSYEKYREHQKYLSWYLRDTMPLSQDQLRLATMMRRVDSSSYHQLNFNEVYFYRAEGGKTVVHKILELPDSLFNPLKFGTFNLTYATFGTQNLVLGMNGQLFLYDGDGHLIGHQQGKRKRTIQLCFHPGGQLIFDLKSDGTIVVLDTTLSEVAQLILLEDQQWAVVSKDGTFDASPEAFQNLYFKTYDEDDKLEFIELEQIKERFYDPGLLQKILGYSESPIRSTKGLDQIALYPKADLKLTGDSLFIRLQPRNGGIGRVALFANGKELDYDLRKTITDSNMVVDLGLAKYQRFLLHENVVSIQTFNESESLHSPNYNIEYLYSKGPKVSARGGGNNETKKSFSEAVARSANLHIVCIGTSNYAGENIDLTYPDLDANAMSKALYLVGNQLFGVQNEVFVHCLTTQPKDSARAFLPDHIKWQFASRQNIKATLEALQTTTRAQDVVVVYFSGHGKTINIHEKEQFHYLTEQAYTIDLLDKSLLSDITISTAELTDWLKKVPAYKQVVIIDACNAGQAVNDLSGGKNVSSSQRRALDRMSGRAGMYLLAGSADNMKSYEASNYGQGLLTYALLEGMSGQALEVDEIADSNYFISVSRLFDFAQRRVPELAIDVGRIQEPQFTFPSKAGTFDVGIYNKATPIKPAGAKPILINPIFVSDYFLSDTLGLAEQVVRYLRLENQKGAKAAFIFVDDNQFPNAYELRGCYTLEADGKVWLNLYLIRPNETPLEIKVPPGNTKTIADDIVWELMEVLIKLKEND